MSTPEDWIEHRRDDGELVGWIVPEGDDFATYDLLGRRAEPTDWLSAEERLNDLGLGYLADIYAYEVATERWIRVRLVEVSTSGIKIKEDDFGDATANVQTMHCRSRSTTGLCRMPRLRVQQSNVADAPFEIVITACR